MRDWALFDLAIDSKVRGCDLVKIKIGTLVTGQEIRTRDVVIQQKTGRPVQFEITADVRASLLAWLERRGGTIDDFAVPSRVDHADHQHSPVCPIGRSVGHCEDYGPHSLRRTKVAMIYKATGNVRAVQILHGHNTVRYLAVDIEDALELVEIPKFENVQSRAERACALLRVGPRLKNRLSGYAPSSQPFGADRFYPESSR